MRYQQLFTFLFFIVFALKAQAAVFTVTSNADSGPGTLREALTLAAANGSATQDVIIFALTDLSEAGRTITLLTELPNVSSNLVISGQTQPGTAFGVTETHIILTLDDNSTVTALFNIVGVTDVEIDGIFFKGNWLKFTTMYPAHGIAINNAGNIRIGQPGAGNLFSGVNYGIWATNSHDIYLKGNIAGLLADGVTSNINYAATGFTDCSNIYVGGSLPGERNVLCDYGQSELSFNRVQKIVVQGNFLGTNYTGNAVVGPSLIGQVYTAYGVVTSACDDITITGNVLSGLGNAIFIYSTNMPYSITNNRLGVGADNTANLNNRNAISVFNSTQKGTISNNVIAYNETAVLINNSQPVTITQNSFFCNINNPINIQSSPVAIPYINVTAKSATQVSGNATPNSTVELFYTDECQLCQGKTYIATVTANAAGNWVYNGPLGGGVVATATNSAGSTSPFSSPQIITNNAAVKDAMCGADGAITGFSYANATSVQWLDESGAIVGTNIDLVGVLPGKYRLRVDNGTCSSVSAFYEVKDKRFSINAAGIVKSNPTCGQPNGNITGIIINNPGNAVLTLQWVDDNTGLAAPDGADLQNAAPGSYTLHVKNNSGCEKTYGPVILTDVSLAINEAAVVATPTKCYEATGSITGMVATGNTGALKYSWRNDSNLEVSTNRDLTGQPPGRYMLMVADESNCGPVFSLAHEILGTNDIVIDISTRAVTNATCDEANGAIKNITVTPDLPGAIYVWYNESNQVVSNSKDLLTVIGGTYTLSVIGGQFCTPVTSQPITVQNLSSVSLDLSGQGGVSPSCNRSDGSITGLQAPGATTYDWTITGTTTNVGHNLDLTGVPAGLYTLTISNSTCSKSFPFEIQGFPPTLFTDITYVQTKTCDAFPTGTITLNTDNANEEPRSYKWFDEQGNPVGYTKQVQFLKAGNYHLVLEDKNYCLFDLPVTFTIEAYPELKVTRGTETHIQCGVGTGSVTATTVTGGTGSYTYQWKNADTGQELPGKTQPGIDGLAAGNYILEIRDDGGCNNFPIPYTIVDQPATPPTPIADNIQLYGAGRATIKVKDAFPTAIYRIYESATSPLPIKDTIGGDININVTESRSYYISLTYGYCESARAEVKVFLSALSGGIPNTFTPNEDGVNDLWNIPGLESYPSATVNIFNRNGQSIYRSVGYARPFDGNHNGKQLPAGVYYYIITLRKGEVLSGYVAILR